MNDYILFRRHETSKARGTEINLCTKRTEKEKGGTLIVFTEGKDSSRSSKSAQEIVTLLLHYEQEHGCREIVK